MLILMCASLVLVSLLVWTVWHPDSGLMSVLVVVSSALVVTAIRSFTTARAFVLGQARSSW